jgi:hypothetical protein
MLLGELLVQLRCLAGQLMLCLLLLCLGLPLLLLLLLLLLTRQW